MLVWGGYMKVSDIDIDVIYKLLLSVPQGMEIESIALTKGYSLKLIAGTEELHAVEKQQSLNELNHILKQYNKLGIGDDSKKAKCK